LPGFTVGHVAYAVLLQYFFGLAASVAAPAKHHGAALSRKFTQLFSNRIEWNVHGTFYASGTELAGRAHIHKKSFAGDGKSRLAAGWPCENIFNEIEHNGLFKWIFKCHSRFH